MNDCYYAKRDWRECKKEVSYNIHQSEHISSHLKPLEGDSYNNHHTSSSKPDEWKK
jgi:hypothetical protein